MTFIKKTNSWIMGGLLLVFLSAAIVILCIERQYYRLELNCSVKNIEISLGVVLAKPLYTKNNELIESLINQIFDQGVLYMLQVRGAHNELLISQNKKITGYEAPGWFVNLIRWPSQLQTITVMYNQKPVGGLLVAADPSYAYEAMWVSLLALLIWFCFWVVVGLVVNYFFSKHLVGFLKRLTKQFHALSNRQFIIDAELPSIVEFKEASMAVNQSVINLKTHFQNQLHHLELVRIRLFQDQLTGFGNNRYFTYQLSSLLYRDEEFIPGFMIGVAIEHLVEFKKEFGDIHASQFIKNMALLCFHFWESYPDLSIARIEDGQFALIIKENDEQLLIKKCEEFSQKIQKLISENANCPIVVGVVSYQAYHEQALLLSEFNQTLASAQNAPYNLVFSPNLSTHHQRIISKKEFKNILHQELEYLYAQPVSNGKYVLHQEIVVQIPLDEEVMGSMYFMPMTRELGLTWQLDSFLLTQICEKELLGEQSIAFTLSHVTLSNEQLLETCLLQLKALSPEHRSRLNFEVDEYVVFKCFARLVGFCKKLHDLGIKLGVKQAGIHFSAMSYLNELPLSYLKLHSSLSHELDEDKEFILHYFHEISIIFGIELIATEIQTQKEWEVVESMGVHWGQGAYFNQNISN